jgi:hypothetical protein
MVEAAIRHAEKVVRTSGQAGPVLFHPTTAKKPYTKATARGDSDASPINPAMRLAVRSALGMPNPDTPAKSDVARAAHPKAAIDPRAQARTGPSRVQKTKTPTDAGTTLAQPTKKRKAPKKRTGPIGQPTVSKKARARRAGRSPIAVPPAASETASVRRKGAASNAASRLAINARMRTAASAEAPKAVSPFPELQRRWQAAFSYLQRFAEANPDAADVVEARRRLAEVEREWERLQALDPNSPDCFPWPSTDAPAGDGDGHAAAGAWQEIGMLAYLGYHVGLSSTLTAAQRMRLLGHVFVMRLPPLNGIAYMRQWGAPDTGTRLRKIAEGLASFARNAKRRRNPNLAEAIRQWEDDLEGLRRAHYVGRFDFPWPAP